MSNTIYKNLLNDVENDILKTQYTAISNANKELINLYYRIGKIIDDNSNYGANFINDFAQELQWNFPKMKGFSKRNLYRMYNFYKEYKDFDKLPNVIESLSWTNNITLIQSIKDIDTRLWYANKCIENGWSNVVLVHQIESDLYTRQKLNPKLTNFDRSLDVVQSELARDILKDPYIFELTNLKERAVEKDIEQGLINQIKDTLLELGKGFSFVGNQVKISTDNNDYYIDLLFYHLDLRSYVVVELKNTKFKPEYVGQLNFYVTAVNNTLKKDTDNDTIGLLLCKEKDRLSVEWSLQSTNQPIGVSSNKVTNKVNNTILKDLPTEEDINKYINIFEDQNNPKD